MAIKYGKSTPFEAVFMEIHYNNPEGATDATDASGFTAILTTTPREHKCAPSAPVATHAHAQLSSTRTSIPYKSKTI